MLDSATRAVSRVRLGALRWVIGPSGPSPRTTPLAVLDEFQERFDCWNRGELDQMLAMYADDAVFDLSAVFTDMRPAHGHADIRAHWNRMWEVWGGLRMDVREVHEGSTGRYAVLVRLWGVGRESGAAVDQLFAMLYTIGSDGKARSAKLLPDMEAAISAVTPHT